jgi:hypothetical protein
MSEKDKAIVKFNPDSGFEFTDIDSMFRAAECYLQSGFAPKGFQSPQQLVICWARAAELGVRPLQAVDGMQVINNRLGIGGDLALALVRAKGLLALTCTVELQRKGDDESREYTFSVAEAKAADIYNRSPVWRGYPKRMTYYRALGFGLRDLFTDVLKGMVTSEELHDYPDIFESDKAKIAYNRAQETEAKARGQKFVEPKPGAVRPTPAEAVEPAFEEDKKPDLPPFAEKLKQDVAQPEEDQMKPPGEVPDDLDMTPTGPETPAAPKVEQKPLRPEWMDYVIKSIPHRRFFGRKISELEPADLLKIETQWIPKIESDMENANQDQRIEYKHFQSAIAHSKAAKPF